ncbi:MAG TPA: hypothetical protein VHB99_14605 [Pirellulales bacterium]|nr:hypothetical protein [Pirellulales bacterium]
MDARGTKWIRPTRSGDEAKMWMSLPHDLTKLSPEQQQWCVAYHAAMPLAEIRRRQELTDRQIGLACRQRNDFALANLRVREAILARAAERKLPPPGSPSASRAVRSPRVRRHDIIDLRRDFI